MKKSILKIALSGRFFLAALGITLAISVVSCQTASPDKPAIATNRSQTPATKPANQPTTEADLHKPNGSYYTCGMHPEVRSLDPDGKCPICNMPLLPADTVLVVDPVSGKTNTAATFPAVSGYYSCPMHPTVLSHDPDGKCPDCKMPLLPVENPIFHQDK
jgi:hypothetical protein